MAKVLLVDDNNILRGLQAEVLRNDGHSVFEACDGNKALALARENTFDLVITDIVMPDKEGIETIIELRRMNSSVKIIAMSGGGQINAQSYLAIAGALGAVMTLQKPFSGQELSDAVNSVLGL